MKRFLLLLLAAPLALSACGDSEVDDRVVDTGDSDAVEVNLPATQPDYPLVPADARSTVDYQGTYSQRTADGRERTIMLGEGDTFTMRDEDGVESSGTYNWYSDNSRILIKRNGENEVYAIADGALYRLADENAPTTGPFTEDAIYRRVVGPGGPMETTGSAGTERARPSE